MSKSEDGEPAWLSTQYDHLHQKMVAEETEPLFGTGKILLVGEVDDPPEPADVEDDEEQGQSNTKYGSIVKDDDKASVTSNRSKGSKKKQQPKKKKKAPPPKSIFDEDNHDNDDEGSSKSESSLDTKPHMPKRNWCLEYFRIVSAVTGVASIGLLATQMIPLFLAPLDKQGYFDLALKGYVSLFCILFLMVEFDAPIPFVRNSSLLQTFLPRGFLYSFLGLICLEEAYSERVKEMVSSHGDEFHVAWASLFMQISSWVVFGCGIWYMCMGLCCLKRLRDKMRMKDKKVWAKYRRALKEWKRLH